MKVTRIARAKNLNPGKYAALEDQARRLGTIRSEVWQRGRRLAIPLNTTVEPTGTLR